MNVILFEKYLIFSMWNSVLRHAVALRIILNTFFNYLHLEYVEHRYMYLFYIVICKFTIQNINIHLRINLCICYSYPRKNVQKPEK